MGGHTGECQDRYSKNYSPPGQIDAPLPLAKLKLCREICAVTFVLAICLARCSISSVPISSINGLDVDSMNILLEDGSNCTVITMTVNVQTLTSAPRVRCYHAAGA